MNAYDHLTNDELAVKYAAAQERGDLLIVGACMSTAVLRVLDETPRTAREIADAAGVPENGSLRSFLSAYAAKVKSDGNRRYVAKVAR